MQLDSRQSLWWEPGSALPVEIAEHIAGRVQRDETLRQAEAGRISTPLGSESRGPKRRSALRNAAPATAGAAVVSSELADHDAIIVALEEAPEEVRASASPHSGGT